MIKKLALAAAIACLSQGAVAKVYMCVDQATGKTMFTDKGCAAEIASAEEVKVEPTNLDSGARSGTAGKEKAWNSERDSRKTGRDYNNDRRSLYEDRATAQY